MIWHVFFLWCEDRLFDVVTVSYRNAHFACSKRLQTVEQNTYLGSVVHQKGLFKRRRCKSKHLRRLFRKKNVCLMKTCEAAFILLQPPLGGGTPLVEPMRNDAKQNHEAEQERFGRRAVRRHAKQRSREPRNFSQCEVVRRRCSSAALLPPPCSPA